MLVTGLDNQEYNLKLNQFSKKRKKCSSLHLRARTLIHNIVGKLNVYEEVPLLGSSKPPTIVDFFIPELGMIIEVQGEQHSKFNAFFYEDRLDFKRAQCRDRIKKSWAELNEFILVELIYNETDEEWKKKITSAFSPMS